VCELWAKWGKNISERGVGKISEGGVWQRGKVCGFLGSELICGWESAFDILLWGFGFWLLLARNCLRFGDIINVQTGSNEIINEARELTWPLSIICAD